MGNAECGKEGEDSAIQWGRVEGLWWGGLFKNRDLILPSILTTISDGGGGEPQIIDPAGPPAYGAAVWGFQRIGVEIFV